MSFPVWCELVCCQCAETISNEFTYGPIKRRSMKKFATFNRWKLINDDWYCRPCAARHQQKQEEESRLTD